MKKRPFIIDCDTGTDDAIAIMAALYSEELELKAITSVNGNVAEEYTSHNNLNLMEYLGQDIPVARGAVRPLVNTYVNHGRKDSTHGLRGLGESTLPEAQRLQFDKRIASDLIYETAVECGGELELLVIGPMTNIALALIQHGDLAQYIRHIWFMGGAAVGGNVTPSAEFNIWVDPEAAHIVCGSGIPMTMVGLDVTTKAVMIEEDAERLRAARTRASDFAAELLEYMFLRRDKGGEDALMHDALALAAALDPECLTCERCYVDVEYRGTYTAGHTMVDRRGRTGKEPNTDVAMQVDVPRFRRWLVDAINCSAGRGA